MIRNGSRRKPNRRLQELRINAGWSPNQLAYEAGTSGKTIRLAEAGFVPGPRIQLAVAEALRDPSGLPELKPTDIWPLDRNPVGVR